MQACGPITPALSGPKYMPVVTTVTVVGLVPWTVLIIAAVRVIPSDINACVRPGVGMSVWHMESRKGKLDS